MADDMSMTPTRDDFEALLNESMGGRDFMEGSVVKGKVVGIEKDFAIERAHVCCQELRWFVVCLIWKPARFVHIETRSHFDPGA